jgi:hypothetical protein
MSHPNIVPIHGADEIDGNVFFVMGFVDGDSLAATIRGMGRLDATDTARMLRDVAAALTHAHARGIIHRDIKAENILMERATGRAMVTDFGIARLAEAGPLTATGQLLGTVYYVSPEQVAGEKIDHRSDIYSLGVVGYLALTGTFPFDAELASAVLIAHVNKTPPPVRSIATATPPALAAIIDRCLAKDPARRFDSTEALLQAFESFIAGGGRASAAAPAPKPKLVSDTEAHEVWGRAASLQALTGVQSRPDITPRQRDEAADARRTSGLAVYELRDAGREAGITTRYMDRALVEHGLAPAPTPSVPQRSSWWAGIPTQIVERTEVEGELDPSRFDGVLNLLRDATGEAGSITASRREVGWRAEWFGSTMTASVVPADGKTSINIVQRVRGLAAATLAGTTALAALLGPLAAVISFELMWGPTPRWVRALGVDLFVARTDRQWIAMWVGLVTAAVTIPLGRVINRMWRRRVARRVALLTEAARANIRLAIVEDERK